MFRSENAVLLVFLGSITAKSPILIEPCISLPSVPGSRNISVAPNAFL